MEELLVELELIGHFPNRLDSRNLVYKSPNLPPSKEKKSSSDLLNGFLTSPYWPPLKVLIGASEYIGKMNGYLKSDMKYVE